MLPLTLAAASAASEACLASRFSKKADLRVFGGRTTYLGFFSSTGCKYWGWVKKRRTRERARGQTWRWSAWQGFHLHIHIVTSMLTLFQACLIPHIAHNVPSMPHTSFRSLCSKHAHTSYCSYCSYCYKHASYLISLTMFQACSYLILLILLILLQACLIPHSAHYVTSMPHTAYCSYCYKHTHTWYPPCHLCPSLYLPLLW